MSELITALLTAWTQIYHAQPFYTAVIGVGGVLGGLGALARLLAARIELRAPLAVRPVLVLSAAVTSLVCLLWAAIDGVLWWQDAPLLGERILGFLVSAAVDDLSALRAAMSLPAGTGLRLPGAITMPLGLLMAGALYLGLAMAMSSTLAEMIALEQRPDDVIRRERERAALAAEERAAAEAAAAEAAGDQAAGGAAPAEIEGAGGDRVATAGADGDQAAGDQTAGHGSAGSAAAGATATRASGLGTGQEGAGTGAITVPATRGEAGADADAVPAQPLADDGLGRLYKMLGHWYGFRHVEPRFTRWYTHRVTWIGSLVLAGAVPAAMGHLPVPAWVGTAILAAALRLRASVPPPGEAAEESAADTGATVPRATPAPAALLAQDPELAPHLVPVDQAGPARPGAAPAMPPGDATADGGVTPVLDEILRALGVRRLYTHQARVARAFGEGRSVLLCTPPGSGRALITDALVLRAVLVDAENVLYLAPDATAARQAQARLEARTAAAHWHWNFVAADLTRPAGPVDPAQLQPALIFADPAAVHRELCARQERWQTFLAGLGAVVVPDLHVHHGARAAHLAHLARRLARAAARARAAAPGPALALASCTDADLLAGARVVATADPAWSDLAGFAQRMLGTTFTCVGPENDGAPRPPQQGLAVRARAGGAGGAPASGAPGALALCERAHERGVTAALHGYDGVLTAAEQAVHAESGQASMIVARLSAARHAALAVMTRHAGRSDAGPVMVLWHPDRDPLAEALASPQPPWQAPGAPALVCWPRAPAVERSHLLCTLAEGEVAVEELERMFAREVLDQTLSNLRREGRLIERSRRLLDPARSVVRTARTVRSSAGEGRDLELSVAGPPWHLVERSSGAIVAVLEAARARAAAYPRRVLVRGGRRFTVLDDDAQDQRAQRRLLCEPGGASGATTPLRRFDIVLTERRERGERRGRERTDGDRRHGGLCRLGGAPFSLQHRDARIDEEVHGLRRIDPAGRATDSTLYESPIRCAFEGRVAVLGLAELEPTYAALHGLVHGFRTVLPALVRSDEEDLEIDALPDSNAIGFVDLHPGGAGFAEAITLDVIRELLRASLALIQACGCADGCPACLHLADCRAPSESLQRLDKAGAKALLTALLGAE